MLFMNKLDLFKEKIRLVDIRAEADPTRGRPARFLDYDLGTCGCPVDEECVCGVENQALKYIENKFRARRNSDLYPYATVATNEKNATVVLDNVKEIILREIILGEN